MSGQDKRAQSIAPDSPLTQQKGSGVAASPFNAIKLELALVLVLAGPLLLLVPATGTGLLWLGLYALAAAGWLSWRTARVARHHQASPGEH